MKCKAILLPTDEPTKIIKDRNKIEFIDIEQIATTINNIVEGFNLCILSDEEIKDGDIVENQGKIYKVLRSGILYNDDFDLMISETLYIKSIDSNKVISLTDKSLGLPTPNDESLKLYCENPTEYIEVETISQLMSYHGVDGRGDYKWYCPTCNEGGSYMGGSEIYCYKSKCVAIKISSNNTINFKPVVEGESWDDIKSAYKEYKQSIKNQYNDKHWLQRVKSILVWLEENYNPPTRK